MVAIGAYEAFLDLGVVELNDFKRSRPVCYGAVTTSDRLRSLSWPGFKAPI